VSERRADRGARTRARAGLVALAAAAALGLAPAQGPTWTSGAPYVSTPPEVVARMIELAEVRAGDVVYDLGCGDGRIVIAAVRIAGVRGVCVEIDPAVLSEARANAERAQLAERIRFVEGDLFEVPIQDATVVTLYLMPLVNRQLRPRLLRELRPGTRVVSHRFDMGDEWTPERTVEVDLGGQHALVHRWTIPAPAPGAPAPK
jgi:SAM-dependent methyltransferase